VSTSFVGQQQNFATRWVHTGNKAPKISGNHKDWGAMRVYVPSKAKNVKIGYNLCQTASYSGNNFTFKEIGVKEFINNVTIYANSRITADFAQMQ
jgi:hypothetical protein